MNKIGGHLGQAAILAGRPAVLYRDVLTIDEAMFTYPLSKGSYLISVRIGRRAKNPTIGFVIDWARVRSGQTAALPSAVMKSLRLTRSPRRPPQVNRVAL